MSTFQRMRQPAYGEHARSYNRDTGAFERYRQVDALPLRPGQVVPDVGTQGGVRASLRLPPAAV